MIFEEIKQGKLLTIRVIDGLHIASVELTWKKSYVFIENIYIEKDYRQRGYFRKLVEHLETLGTLVCIPLPEHVEKFKHIGFTYLKSENGDNYYIK